MNQSQYSDPIGVGIILALVFCAYFFVLRPLVPLLRRSFQSRLRSIRRFLTENQRIEREQERHHRHHLKKISRIDHKLDRGTPYHLGADGEIVFEETTNANARDTEL